MLKYKKGGKMLDYGKVAHQIYEVSMKLRDDLADRLAEETGLSTSDEQVAGPARGFGKMFFNLGARDLADRLDEIDGDIDELAEAFANERGDVSAEVMKNYTKLSYSDIEELRKTFESMEDETKIPSRTYLREVSEIIDEFIEQG